MGARGDDQTRQGDSQHSWTGVGSGANAVLALVLAKFVAATRCHCTVRLESVAKTTLCPSKNANTTIEPSSERPSHPVLAVQIKSRLADGARS